MKLFGKQKETKSCCCGGSCTPETMEKVEAKKQESSIKVLGSGCAKCAELEKSVQLALEELQLDLEIDHVTDFAEIAGYGVMSTPALVLYGKVVSYGKVLSVEEVKTILQQN